MTPPDPTTVLTPCCEAGCADQRHPECESGRCGAHCDVNCGAECDRALMDFAPAVGDLIPPVVVAAVGADAADEPLEPTDVYEEAELGVRPPDDHLLDGPGGDEPDHAELGGES